MKKNGFTLSETLVTLGIIGVAAVLVAPSLVQLLPNKDKMEFMECYKQLTTAIPLINNYYSETIQWDEVSQTYYSNCVGLACFNGSETCDSLGTAKIGCVLNEMIGIEGKYKWSGESEIDDHAPMPPRFPKGYSYAKGHTVTCTSPNNSFVFTLKGNGSIKDIGEDGKKYMKDQFNYHKDGDEEG